MIPILELRHVQMRFGGVLALADVSLRAEEGEVTAVIGPNGAGKTTAINCASGVYRAQGGDILYEGGSIKGHRAHKLARMGLARTFQNLQVFAEMTVLENVMLGMHAITKNEFLTALFRLPGFKSEEMRMRERAEETLERLGLASMMHKLAGEMPYGDQKRVEMARALVSQPKLVLLDEPAAGLSPSETVRIADLIDTVRDEGLSVVLVEHDMDLVMDVSDRVVVLNYGRKIAEGTPAQMQSNPEVIDAYLGVGSKETAIA